MKADLSKPMIAAIPGLRAYAASLCRNREDAEDLLQSTLLKGWAKLDAFEAGSNMDLQPGDLIGTGTISGPSPAEPSSMLEFTAGGTQPVVLPNGERRVFLQDGDEITFRGKWLQNHNARSC
jgi:Fumarylacetoacetate (FAA) hydrolase family/Sigma-70 region 2